MKTFTKTILAMLASGLIGSALFTPQAQATQITGGISFGGGYTTDTGNINTATTFTSFLGVTVVSVSGDYSSVPTGNSSPPVTMNGFTFNPFTVPVQPLWTFVFGGNTYSFDLNAITSRSQPGDNTLTLQGTGYLMITGFDSTFGTWVLTANQAGFGTETSFSFSSSNGASPTPDGGTGVALLGLSLLGLGVLRRKLGKA